MKLLNQIESTRQTLYFLEEIKKSFRFTGKMSILEAIRFIAANSDCKKYEIDLSIRVGESVGNCEVEWKIYADGGECSGESLDECVAKFTNVKVQPGSVIKNASDSISASINFSEIVIESPPPSTFSDLPTEPPKENDDPIHGSYGVEVDKSDIPF